MHVVLVHSREDEGILRTGSGSPRADDGLSEQRSPVTIQSMRAKGSTGHALRRRRRPYLEVSGADSGKTTAVAVVVAVLAPTPLIT